MNNPTQQNININIKDAEDIKCDECENKYFVPTFMIKKVSALMSPTGQEIMAPVQLFQCSSCNHVNKKFLE
jgi:hypothetical protein|tara:strand:+ start:461 stop:673 length:213 start_codon:yes stop_codon:yes gene_type:complete